MKRLRARKHRAREVAELNITAFMNLMVILVPFLLMTAVFSRLAVLELNLPNAQSEGVEPPEPEFALEITVREAGIEVGDRAAGVLSRIENTDGGYDLGALREYLQRVKSQFPDKADATLLLEPEISYEVLVDVMDAVRLVEAADTAGDGLVRYELFPEISIGDAPVLN